MLFSSVEHRAWIKALEEYIADRCDELPPMGRSECRFGRWLADEGKSRYGAEAVFERIVSLHDQIHSKGSALGMLRDGGQQEKALSQLDSLHELKDALLKELRKMLMKQSR